MRLVRHDTLVELAASLCCANEDTRRAADSALALHDPTHVAYTWCRKKCDLGIRIAEKLLGTCERPCMLTDLVPIQILSFAQSWLPFQFVAMIVGIVSAGALPHVRFARPNVS